jgi:hypothetical protein
VYYKCVKFHKNPISGLGGTWTDRVIPIYPPNFVCGGYNNKNHDKNIVSDRDKNKISIAI